MPQVTKRRWDLGAWDFLGHWVLGLGHFYPSQEAREKGDRHLLCEAPEGPLAAKGACHLFPKAVNLFLPLAKTTRNPYTWMQTVLPDVFPAN